jgi:Lysylphosphatidylglycerol synthase TM region
VSRKTVAFLLKTGFAAALIGAIWWDFSQKDNLGEIWVAFKTQVLAGDWPFLAMAVILMPFNWATETLKWHQFVARYEPNFTFFRGYQAVLAGVAFSLFLPNRVGEYGGRIFFVRPENQWKAVIANLVGNFSQIIFLMVAGSLGAAWFMYHFLHIEPLLVNAIVVGALGAAGAMLFAYFNIDVLIPLVRRIPYIHLLKKFTKNLTVLKEFRRRELAEILFWSVVRCLIYSTQYLLLLTFFGIKPGILNGYSGIFALFFIQMSVPLPPITALLARGNIALHVWSLFGANEVSILASTLSLWTLNLIFPSFFGAIFLLKTNVTKTFGYNDDEK